MQTVFIIVIQSPFFLPEILEEQAGSSSSAYSQ